MLAKVCLTKANLTKASLTGNKGALTKGSLSKWSLTKVSLTGRGVTKVITEQLADRPALASRLTRLCARLTALGASRCTGMAYVELGRWWSFRRSGHINSPKNGGIFGGV